MWTAQKQSSIIYKMKTKILALAYYRVNNFKKTLN